MQIVLFEPEIPPNTGNIARLCAATGTTLNLIEPLGFALQNRYLKRAGLDYWPHVTCCVWKNWGHFLSQKNPAFFCPRSDKQIYAQPQNCATSQPSVQHNNILHSSSVDSSLNTLCDPITSQRLIMVSSKKRARSTSLFEFTFHAHDFLVFGPETRGLPEEIVQASPWQVRVPMKPDAVRSLNLSTCAGIVLYFALQSIGIPQDWL